jgi:YVTN family beta-propeller protein
LAPISSSHTDDARARRSASARLLAPLTVLLLACFGSAAGQWFDGWITLPDSLNGVEQVQHLAHDSATNTVWVGGRWSDCLLAIDADINTVVARVHLPGNDIVSLCSNTASSTMFCTMYGVDSVIVIDCSSHAVVAAIPAQNPELLFYNPIDNKVYCSVDNDQLLIIDGRTNEFIKTLPATYYANDFCQDTRKDWIYSSALGGFNIIDGAGDTIIATFTSPQQWHDALCYSSLSDLVYCAHYIDNVVLALNRDTIVAEIPVGRYTVDLCYNPIQNKVYTADWNSGTVTVISCDSNTVKTTINTGGSPEILEYDDDSNRIFCAIGNQIVVIDGTADTIIDRFPMSYNRDALLLNQANRTLYFPKWTSQYQMGVLAMNAESGDSIRFIPTMGMEKPRTACWSSVRNKVYVACQGSQHRLGVIDGSSGSILGWVHTGFYPCALVYSPVFDRIYCADSGSGSVTVVDCATDSVLATVRVGESPVSLLDLPDDSRLYCANRTSGTVSIIDPASNTVVRTVQTGTSPCALAYSPTSDKVYCTNQSGQNISVIDRPSGSVVRTIQLEGNPSALAYSSARDRLYCVTPAGVTAIECRNDSVLGQVAVEEPSGIAYNPDLDRIYCGRNRNTGRTEWTVGFELVSCSTNQSIGGVDIGVSSQGARSEFAYNTYNRRMFCNSEGNVRAYSGNSVVMYHHAFGFGGGFAWNRRDNRMYVTCQDDSRIAVYRSTGGGVEEAPGTGRTSGTLPATMVRGTLVLPESPVASRQLPSALLDVSGRAVMALHPGANNVRHLPAGIYFIRPEPCIGPGAPDVRKIVVSK